MKNYILLVWKVSEKTIRLFLLPDEEISFEGHRSLRIISCKFLSTFKNIDDSKESRELSIKVRLIEIKLALDTIWEKYEIYDIFPKLKDDQHIKHITISGE